MVFFAILMWAFALGVLYGMVRLTWRGLATRAPILRRWIIVFVVVPGWLLGFVFLAVILGGNGH